MITMILLLNMIMPAIMPNVSADEDFEPLSVSLSINENPVKTGKVFVYSISYSVLDLEKDYKNVYIKSKLPDDVEYVSYAANSQVVEPDELDPEYSKHYIEESNEIIFKIANDDTGTHLLAGSQGLLEVNVRVKDGSCGGETLENQVTIEADGVAPIPSNKVYIQTETISADESWEITKNQTGFNYMPGSNVTYNIKLQKGNEDYGRVNLKNVRIEDYLPREAVFVSATGDYGYDTVAHKVYWDIGNVFVSQSPLLYSITLNYPATREIAGETVTNVVYGQTVTNTVYATGSKEWDDSDVLYKIATEETTFVEPMPPTQDGIGFRKRVEYLYRWTDYKGEGQVQTYTIDRIRNNGNVPVDNFVVTDDDLPAQMDYTSIKTPNGEYIFEYKTSKYDWTPYSVSPGDNISISDFVYSDDYLTGIRFNFGTVPPGFDAGTIQITGKVKDPDNEGNPVEHKKVISNTANLSFRYCGTTTSIDSSADFTIHQPKPWIRPTIEHNYSMSYLPEDKVTFNLIIENRSGATGDYKNPIIYNLLPENFELITDSIVGEWESNVSIPAPTVFEVVYNFRGSNRTLIKWSWDNYALPIGEDITINYDTKIKKYTLPTSKNGTYDNQLYITTNDNPEFWWGDNPSLDQWQNERDTISDPGHYEYNFNESVETEYLVEAETNVVVNEIASVVATKWNKGILDDLGENTVTAGNEDDVDAEGYKKYPLYGATIEGGSADYKLEVLNEGNINIKRIEILDILPYIGDTAVLTSQDRKSMWRPNLIGEVEISDLGSVTADVDVYYSTSSDKDYINLDYPKTDMNYWMNSIPPEFDISSIQSIYFDIKNINNGEGLNPGEKIILKWKMRAPLGSPDNVVAWNSIGVRSTTEYGTVLNPAEPNKVGFKTLKDDRGQIGDFVWFDSNGNGIQDDGYDSQEAGINGIKVKLYEDSNSNGIAEENEFIDETVTANNHEGKPGYYLFPGLSSADQSNKRYILIFELPDYYQPTKKHELTGSGEPDDSDAEVVNGRVQTNVIELQYDPETSRLYQNHDVDLGLINSDSKNANMEITKKAISVLDENQTVIESVYPHTDPVNVDETIIYQIEVKNTGSVPLHNVKIQDVVEGGKTGFTFTEVGFNTGNLLSIDESPIVMDSVYNKDSETSPYIVIDKIEVGDTLYVRGKYKITQADINDISLYGTPGLDNTIKIWSNETHDNDIPFEYTYSVDIADLDISKTSDISINEGVEAGQNITYTITITNNGSVDLYGVKVSDNNIDQFIGIDTNERLSLITEDDKDKVVIDVVYRGESVDIKGVYTVREADISKKVSNTAVAEHDDIRYSLSSTHEINTEELLVEKTADKLVAGVDETITYTITLTNNSTKSLSNVKVISDILTSSKNSGNPQELKGGLMGSIPSILGKDQSVSLNLDYLVTENDIDELNGTKTIINTVYATSDDTVKVVTDFSKVDIVHIDLEKNEVSTGPYAVGDTIEYEIVVTNLSSIPLSDIIVKDRLFNLNGGNDYTEIVVDDSLCLAKNETKTYKVTHVLTQEDLLNLNSNKLKNKAIVHVQEINRDFEVEAEVDTVGIKLDKTVYKGNYIPGENGSERVYGRSGTEITYLFKITNIGSTYLYITNLYDNELGIDLSDVQHGYDYVSNIAPGHSSSCYYESIINGNLKNTATVEAKPTDSDGNDINTKPEGFRVTDTDDASVYIYKLTIDKAADKSEVKINDVINYTITVRNEGEDDLHNVAIVDDLLNINENVGTLTVADSVYKITKAYKITQQVIDENPDNIITNTAKAYSDEIGEIEDTENVVIITNPELEVRKIVSQNPAEVGQTIKYTIIATNKGDITLHNLKLSDSLLTSTSDYINLGDLTVGQSVYKTIDYTIKNNDPNPLTNVAQIISDETGLVNSNECKVDITDKKLGIMKSAPGEARIGDIIDYIITVTNEGSTIIEDVYVEDELLGFFRKLDYLGAGESKTWSGLDELKYTVTENNWPGGITNLVTASGTVNETVVETVYSSVYGEITTTRKLPPVELYAEGSVYTRVIGNPHLTFIKDADKKEAKAGDVITYILLVKNTGDVALTNVRVIDEMLGIDETVTKLGVDETKTYTGTYTVTEADEDAGKLINIATASSKETNTLEDKVEVAIIDDRPHGGGGGYIPPQLPEEPILPEQPQPPMGESEVPPEELNPEHPAAGQENKRTYEETPVSGKVEIPAGGKFEVSEEPKNGRVTIDKDGNWKYEPNPGFIGSDKFKLKVIDQNGNEREIIIEIDVEKIPAGTLDMLPKTGENSKIFFYIIGLLFILVGIYLGKKNKTHIRTF
jgi:uncharacterized repeat protein (TIGR01451 family)/LPXTG-motif cell wall-anchored protein